MKMKDIVKLPGKMKDAKVKVKVKIKGKLKKSALRDILSK